MTYGQPWKRPQDIGRSPNEGNTQWLLIVTTSAGTIHQRTRAVLVLEAAKLKYEQKYFFLVLSSGQGYSYHADVEPAIDLQR